LEISAVMFKNKLKVHFYLGCLTESQNVRGWQGPLWVTQPNPLLKQDHPEQAAQHRVQVGLEYLFMSLNLCSLF